MLPRGNQIFLVALFLLLIFGVPFCQAGLEIYHGSWPQLTELFTKVPTRSPVTTL